MKQYSQTRLITSQGRLLLENGKNLKENGVKPFMTLKIAAPSLPGGSTDIFSDVRAKLEETVARWE